MEKKSPFTLYSYAFSNFLAAFGGGLILAKGMNVIGIPYLNHASILAFLIGTVLGLIFLQSIPSHFSIHFSKWFSVCGSACSFILLGIFIKFNIHEKLFSFSGIFFFILLSLRFSFWFYSRVLRAAKVAEKQQSLAWVEFGYYSGIILGLILWTFIGTNYSLVPALIIDGFLQLSAAIIDTKSAKKVLSARSEKILLENNLETERAWGTRLILSVVLLTVGVQVIIFNQTENLTQIDSAYILATFYLGAAIAAFVFKKYKFEIFWEKIIFYYPILSWQTKGAIKQVNAFLFFLLCVLSVFMMLLNIYIYLFVFAAAFFYEILALGLFDRMGQEDKNKQSKMVIRSYGLMGINSAITFWILGWISHSTYFLFILLFTCIGTTYLTLLGFKNR